MRFNFPRILLFGTLGFALIRAEATEQIYTVTGIIQGKLDDGRLIIEHQEIPGYMAAMTMPFDVADANEVKTLKIGDEVRFRYRVGGEKAVAESFLVIGHKAPPVPPKVPPAKIRRVRAGDAAPEFTLIDENGHPFTHERLRGQFTVMTFIFTRCPVPEFCPAMATKFASLQSTVMKEKSFVTPVRLVSVTLDPEYDRPAILANYGKAVGAKPGIWGFATGETAEAAGLARAFSVFSERNGVTLDHTLCTALIGPDGRVVELWRGNGWSIDDVLAKVRDPH
jgi:protein SCO1/2